MSFLQYFPTWFFALSLVLFNSIGWVHERIIEISVDNPVESQIRDYDQSQFQQAPSPTGTIVFNLPVIENSIANATPGPSDGYPEPESTLEIPTGTPTPTSIPVQTGSVNVPIVLGALAIITVIILAWFFAGYLPSKIED